MPDKTTEKKNWFKRHKIVTGIIAAIVLISIGAAAGGSNNQTTNTGNSTDTSSTTNTASTSQTSNSTTTKINQQANDGDFGFTVTAFQCGQSTLTQPDNTDWTSTAQGQFCTLNLSIKNIKTQAQEFDDSSQYVYSASGTQYSPDSDATITANASGSQCAGYATINPGNSLQCVVAFDVPKGMTPAYAMLHDSSASDGVKVSLTQ